MEIYAKFYFNLTKLGREMCLSLRREVHVAGKYVIDDGVNLL